MIDQVFLCYYNFCGKEFNNKYNLKRHINAVHLVIRGFSCEVCAKHLASKVAYREHLSSHLGIRPLKCPVIGCNLRFSRSSLLCAHRKCHSSTEALDQKTKKYEKKKSNLDLPQISILRRAEQSNTKIPVDHRLLP